MSADLARTYRLEPDPAHPGAYTITCLRCGRTSAHPADVAELYCVGCHWFHEDPVANA
jgi:hypothetical protein